MKNFVLSLIVLAMFAAVANTIPPVPTVQAPAVRVAAVPLQAPPLRADCQCPPGSCPGGCPCGCQASRPVQAPAIREVVAVQPIKEVVEDCTIVYRDPAVNRRWRFTRPDGADWQWLPEAQPAPVAASFAPTFVPLPSFGSGRSC